MLEFWLAEDDRNKVASSIAPVEARSAICRLRKGSRMTADEASVALASVDTEMLRLIQQSVSHRVLEDASALVVRHHLRALDAVQLGSATIFREAAGQTQMRFISSDHTLLAAALAEGFATWNPAENK